MLVAILTMLLIAAGGFYFLRVRRRSLIAAAESHYYRQLLTPRRLLGHLVTEEEIECGHEPGGEYEREVRLVKYRQAVHGILPEWVSFGWWPERPHEEMDRNDLWISLLFGERALGLVPAGGSIHGARGDLVYESGVRRHSATDHVILELGQIYLERKLDLRAEMVRAALEDDLRRRCIALRVLLQHLPEDEGTARALASAESSVDAELRAIAAAVRGDRGVLRQLADDRSMTDATREEAIRALLALRDDEGLLGLQLHPVPAAVAGAYLEALHRIRDPRGEPIAQVYLDGSVRSAAIDTLAAVGTRDSVPRLRDLLEKRISDEERVGIDVAIELIQDRITGGSDARGAMSLAGEEKAGRLSSAPSGELSNTEE